MGNSRLFIRLVLAGLALAASGTARASEHADNRLTVGVGMIVAPDYEGSNDYVIRPAFGALARLHGHNIAFKGTSLSIDLVPEYRDQKFKIVVAPFANLDFDRSDTPHDPVVGLIRKRKVALEMGGTVGLTWNGVITSKYDTLTLQVSASHDVGKVSKSFIVTPTVQYLTPMSEKSIIGMSLSADVVGARFARYYFGVGPNASAASGLTQYTPSGGLKSATVGLLGAYALGHDLNHGFALGALFSYERLLGDFTRSPLVTTRGSRGQLVGSLGLGYTF
jgi:outer membrane scaffolding protein for murein synthesis (MipA/OmpV family)